MLSTFQTKIDPSGRITLPPEILSELHLEPGMMLSIRKNKEKITLEPVSTEEPMLIEKEGVLVLHAQLTEDISNIVENVRDNHIAEQIEEFAQ